MIMLPGKANAKNIGTSKYAGVVRSGKKYLSRSMTASDTPNTAEQAKIPDPKAIASDSSAIALAVE
jgi:hypothetical protein